MCIYCISQIVFQIYWVVNVTKCNLKSKINDNGNEHFSKPSNHGYVKTLNVFMFYSFILCWDNTVPMVWLDLGIKQLSFFFHFVLTLVIWWHPHSILYRSSSIIVLLHVVWCDVITLHNRVACQSILRTSVWDWITVGWICNAMSACLMLHQICLMIAKEASMFYLLQ